MARTPLELSELLSVANDSVSIEDLRTYFEVDRASGERPAFEGRRFEALAGGDDREDCANRITADDLVAVQMLSVRLLPKVTLDLLEGSLGDDIAESLVKIPTDVDLGDDAAPSLLADDGPADRAWQLLRRQDRIGWVTAGKLLARKRPRLVPVYARVVKRAFGLPPPMQGHVWPWLHEKFAEDDGALRRRLREVRDIAGVAESVTPLRVLDVIIWMRHHDSHRASYCPRSEFTSLALEATTPK